VDTVVAFIRENYCGAGALTTSIQGSYKKRVTDKVTSLFAKKGWSVSFQQVSEQQDGDYLNVRIQQLPKPLN
jgi:hypothetical protein